MSENLHPSPTATPVPPLAGLGLRQARERAGWQQAALAAQLKVPVRHLEALESGRYDELPDATFARALASSVCRVLKIDAAPILAALPSAAPDRLGQPLGDLNAPMPTVGRSPFSGGVPLGGASSMRRVVGLSVALLLAAVVLWFVLPERVPEPVAPAAMVSAAPEAVAPLVPVAPPVVLEAVPPVPPVPAPLPPLPSLPPPTPLTEPAPPLPAVPQVVAATEAQAADVVQIRASEATWVQVTGASGRVWLQRSLQAGEVVGFSADLPLAVVVGRVDGTQVQVRGTAFDLTAVARNNVARFEVR